MSGDPTHRVRVLVVNGPPDPAPAERRIDFGRGTRGGLAGPVLEGPGFDRSRDPLGHELVESAAAHVRETGGQHHVAEVAVGERAEVLRERLLRGAPDGLLDRVGLLPQREPPLQSGGVGEDVEERDLILPPAAEVGHELAQRRRK